MLGALAGFLKVNALIGAALGTMGAVLQIMRGLYGTGQGDDADGAASR